MHDTAYKIGAKFFETYWRSDFSKVLELGACNVNGALRDFRPEGSDWCGMDLGPGNGVDVVADDPYVYPFEDGSFDIVVSSSCYEHDQFFWLTFLEMLRVTREGGFLYINVPSNGAYHAYPQDCWRFYPDSGLALVAWAKRMKLDVTLVESFIATREADVWNDCVLVFAKGAHSPPPTLLCQTIPGCHNIRLAGQEQLLNARALTEDMVINQVLQNRVNFAMNAMQTANGVLTQAQAALNGLG
ncbi:methyltransferase domain-containing protein [Niveispirillum sp. SYP-B3756]|uniref:methyltransferase domain-containing protein n=1 Tax=Niveispirillum sp. SYP-B3756 TaxID=2662178 RepID=UPI00129243FE|nr:methyltransferase domain-containing protein [Niveispirillum sp. SYP-B3756]MQP64232.1 methyltransferase domain-containing protein [Niveispirillum sp. SYP-B3756]